MGVCGLVLLVPYWRLACVAPKEALSETMCARLAAIPSPPMPTPEQTAAISYTNDYLFQLRSDLGCG